MNLPQTAQSEENAVVSPLERFYSIHGTRITQASERLFVDDFLYPLLNEKILEIQPQHPFIDSTGARRRIDFAFVNDSTRLAFEINGETYHAEGVIPNEVFDTNLFRQNEILSAGYKLIRFSYNQLQSPLWRSIVMASCATLPDPTCSHTFRREPGQPKPPSETSP